MDQSGGRYGAEQAEIRRNPGGTTKDGGERIEGWLGILWELYIFAGISYSKQIYDKWISHQS